MFHRQLPLMNNFNNTEAAVFAMQAITAEAEIFHFLSDLFEQNTVSASVADANTF